MQVSKLPSDSEPDVSDSAEGLVAGRLPVYSLLCGVQELVLAAAAVTHSDAHVCPETTDGVHVAPLQLGDPHRVHLLQPLGIDLKAKRRKEGGGGEEATGEKTWRFTKVTLSFHICPARSFIAFTGRL